MSAPRFALRSLVRARSFAIATTATIALSIGAGCAMFGLVNAVLLRPLPFANPDRLVGIWHTMPGLNIPLAKEAAGTYEVYRESAKSFEDMGMYLMLSGTLSYRDPNIPAERARVGYMTASMFSTLGARPIVGRMLAASDEKKGAEPVALISEPLWRMRFGGTSRVLDRMIEVDGTPRRIVGVMPESFRFPESATP
ncbi:MAG TPA: ABC transporter permease, partial [Gemmatimonadaceae bacterium]